ADADDAFVAGKRRERNALFRTGHWFQGFGDCLIDLLVRYGRRPAQAAIPCAFFVALGCVLFRREKMERQKADESREAKRTYDAFWYSLGLLLPFVDLESDKIWKPQRSEKFLRHY